MRVLVAGSSGLLGSNLLPFLKAQGHDAVGLSRSGSDGVVCDLCDSEAAMKALDGIAPDAVVNLVALTNVDECEREPQRASQMNFETARTLASWASSNARRPHLVHISTDHVYGGPGPHREDSVNVLNVYAESKLRAEAPMLSCGAAVLRTNFFGLHRLFPEKGFLAYLALCIKEGRRPSISGSALFSPLYIPSLLKLVLKALLERKTGLFNAGSKGGCSKDDFVAKLAGLMGADWRNLRQEEGQRPASQVPRPQDMRMDCHCLEAAFNIELPSLDDEIKSAAEDLRRAR